MFAFDELGFNTIEKSALAKVLRESMQEELSDSPVNFEFMVNALNAHSKAMQGIIGSSEYDSLCLNQLIHNIKRLPASEQIAYMRSIESFAKAYSLIFTNKKMLLLALAGIVHTTSGAESVHRYTYELYKIAKEKQAGVSDKAARESIKLDALRHELELHQKSIFRFFRRRRIRALETGIKSRIAYIRRLEARANKYGELAKTISSMFYTKYK